MDRLEFFLSDTHVTLETSLAVAMRAMKTLWRAANRPLVPPKRKEALRVDLRDGSFEIRRETTLLAATPLAVDVAPLVELTLYEAAVGWCAPYFLAHAACVVWGDQAVVFAGRSGAGKSSLALAAVRRGWRYFTDEYTVFDGDRLWGIPRAIHFDPIKPGVAVPWVAGANEDAYPVRRRDGQLGAQPLHPLEPADVPPAALSVRRVWLFFPNHEATLTLQACAPLDALVRLHGLAWSCPPIDVGKLVQAGRTWDLGWRDPGEAVARVEAMLTRDAGAVRT